MNENEPKVAEMRWDYCKKWISSFEVKFEDNKSSDNREIRRLFHNQIQIDVNQLVWTCYGLWCRHIII